MGHARRPPGRDGARCAGLRDQAFRPLTEALLQLLRERPVLDDATLAPWLGALQPLLPTVAAPLPAAAHMPPAVRGEAILRLLRCACPSGVVVLLEDLHWADRDTVSIVEYLADNVRQERLLIVLTPRDNSPSGVLDMALRHPGIGGVGYFALDRLSGEELPTASSTRARDRTGTRREKRSCLPSKKSPLRADLRASKRLVWWSFWWPLAAVRGQTLGCRAAGDEKFAGAQTTHFFHLGLGGR